MKLVWELKEIKLDLAFDWSISREVSQFKINYVIFINGISFGEVAPNIRFNESGENVESAFLDLKKHLPKYYIENNFLKKILNTLNSTKNLPNSLRYGVESAAINYLCDVRKNTLSNFLLETENSLVTITPTLFSIPILELDEYAPFVKKFKVNRFKMIKIKSNNINVIQRVEKIQSLTNANLCIDFNEAFNSLDEFLPIYEELNQFNIHFIEQPFPEINWIEYEKLLKIGKIDIFLDESVTNQDITAEFKKYCNGINVKLMKSGGILQAKKQLLQAKELGLKIMLGCMVETSLSIYNALQLASLSNYQDLDGFLLLKSDPFGKLVEENGLISVKKLGEN